MNILIGNYGIRSSGDHFVLYERHTITEDDVTGKHRGIKPKADQIGTVRETDCGFYGKLEHCLKNILQRDICDSDAKTVDALLATIIQANAMIAASIKEFEPTAYKQVVRENEALQGQMEKMREQIRGPKKPLRGGK